MTGLDGAPLHEFEERARRRLDPVLYDYFAGGGGDELTMRENEAAFARIRLVPRVLRGSDKRQLDVTVLGCPASMPVLLSPTAFHKLAHPDGERVAARAAAAAQTIMMAGMTSTVAIEDVMAAARDVAGGDGPQLWFQLYLQPDPDVTRALVRRAERAGCRALVVTVDSPVLGRRERDDRNGFHDLPEGLACENLRNLRAGEPGHVRQIVLSAELSWDHVDRLREITSLPVVLKGILHPDDARLAVAHGADALLVSNHGGRQLDTVPAAIEALPEIAAAVAGRIPVMVDGGVRRGTDVVKALALGAVAVGIGRPVLWGLAAGGETGVRQVLERLRSEVDHAVALCGCARLDELGPDLLRVPPGLIAPPGLVAPPGLMVPEGLA